MENELYEARKIMRIYQTHLGDLIW